MKSIYKTSDFAYDLPQELIAQSPVEPRDSSRLLHYNMASGAAQDRIFYELADILQKGDLLVVNNTKVMPVRIYGTKVGKDEGVGSGAKVEFLLHKRLGVDTWEALVKPGKRLPVGARVEFSDKLSAEIMQTHEDGQKTVRFFFDGDFETILEEAGQMPLPHYIHEELKNPDRYQTVYAKARDDGGSAAAPTAGLHFTPQLMDKLYDMGVEFAEVLLHVGLGTFRPVKTDNIEEHKMHAEYYEVTEQTASAINKAANEGRRIIAVGTTSVRTLESAAGEDGLVKAGSGDTSIFIYPPYKFKVVKGLITNFHLPESTLIMLVSAFLGREKTLELYKHAVKERYRFFSFGDAMLLL